MEQAGVSKIQLVENKNITARYNEAGVAILLESDGIKIDVDGSFVNDFNISEFRNLNGKIGYTYDIEFTYLDISDILNIRDSIYGFFVLFDFFDSTKKICPIPLLFENSEQQNNISSSFSTKLTNFATTKRALVPFDDSGIEWILESGFWNDDAFWIDSKIWID